MQNKKVITQVSETEFWVGENNTSLINNNTIYVIAVGEQTTEIASQQREVNSKLAALVKGKINYLIDLNKCGKNSPEARKIWNELSADEKTDRVAIYGLHPVAKVIASFVTGVSKSKNERFFNTKEEAENWLINSEVTKNND